VRLVWEVLRRGQNKTAALESQDGGSSSCPGRTGSF